MQEHPQNSSYRQGDVPTSLSSGVSIADLARWWQSTWLLVVLLVASTVPLWRPGVLPLGDLPGHMGQYAIELAAPSDPIRQYFNFHWALIPNIGVDLAMQAIGPFFGPELGTKLVVTSIPPLTILGFALTGQAFHSRRPATLPFAATLAYNQFFLLGFVNFTLSCALAFLAFPLWVWLGRSRNQRLRAGTFVFLSALIWLCQAFGWAILVLLVFAAEWMASSTRKGLLARSISAGASCWPLCVPLFPMLLWQDGTPHNSAEGFGFGNLLLWKLLGLARVLDDRWIALDLISLIVLLVIVGAALRHSRSWLVPPLACGAALLLAAFLLLPKQMMGANHVDDRMLPYALALALLSIRPWDGQQHRLATIGAVFFGARMIAATISLWLSYGLYAADLPALDHVPRGARLATFIEESCTLTWAPNHLEHLPALAIVRRQAYSNDQWAIRGGQLVSPRAPMARFVDPTQLAVAAPCWSLEGTATLHDRLVALPKSQFDYVWLIGVSYRPPELGPSWRLLWSNPTSALYTMRGFAPVQPAEL